MRTTCGASSRTRPAGERNMIHCETGPRHEHWSSTDPHRQPRDRSAQEVSPLNVEASFVRADCWPPRSCKSCDVRQCCPESSSVRRCGRRPKTLRWVHHADRKRIKRKDGLARWPRLGPILRSPTLALAGLATVRFGWRRGSESNRRRRLCRPLHDHSATPPGAGRARTRAASQTKRESPLAGSPFEDLERERSLELPTSTLARLRSTN